ncbi:MAG: hypothetical protein KAJ46_06235, partial [Sedimentisphaerales bacterium]|nr:hypothetical protein [Sedimentisphaerales bacterium]
MKKTIQLFFLIAVILCAFSYECSAQYVSQLIDKIAKLEKDNASLRKTIESLKKELEEFEKIRKENDDLCKKYEQAWNQKEELKRQNNTLRKTLSRRKKKQKEEKKILVNGFTCTNVPEKQTNYHQTMLGLLYQIEATTNVVKKKELQQSVFPTALDYFRKTPMLINWVGCIDKIEAKDGNEIELHISAKIFAHTVNFITPGIKLSENIKLYKKIGENRIYEGQLVKFRANVMDVQIGEVTKRGHSSLTQIMPTSSSKITVKFLDID